PHSGSTLTRVLLAACETASPRTALVSFKISVVEPWPRSRRIAFKASHNFATVDALAVSPQGDILVSVDGKKSRYAFDLKTGQRLWRLSLRESSRALAFSPNGRVLAVGAGWRVKLLTPRQGNELSVLEGHSGRVFSAVFSPDSRFLALTTAGESATFDLVLWDVKAGTKSLTVSGSKALGGTLLGFIDEQRLLCSRRRIWDLRVLSMTPEGLEEEASRQTGLKVVGFDVLSVPLLDPLSGIGNR
ncbi:MAG: hypothetical protein P1V97_38685, partial [Planctomycetota bacterium]|nr:hypothetical protein [Planctomycetota bacterium]